jgi:uncharacterized membrane protein YgcG
MNAINATPALCAPPPHLRWGVLLVYLCVLLAGVTHVFAQEQAQPAEPPQAAQQSADQLQQLVAPIALYPDSLIAQILAAATYPHEVVDAENWLLQHQNLSGDSLAQEVDQQSWDPAVKALTQFPSVLANMNKNLAWTSELGDVYVNQPQDVSAAIQVMRQRAQQAGNLNTNSQQKVTTQGQTIVIEPATTEIVYVPEYDPWVVYGGPVVPFPGWYPYPGLFVAGPGIRFEFGCHVREFGRFGWGWHRWEYDWHRGGRVVYNHNTYISHSTTIVNRNHFRPGGVNFHHDTNFRGGLGRTSGTHSGAFAGFAHGGTVRSNAFRGRSSFGGFHSGGSGGGFRAGGFHGGGHAGGGRR